MDEHFTITIHSKDGVQHFNVHNILKKIVGYGVLLIGIIIFAGVGMALYFYTTTNDMQKEYVALKKENQTLQKHIQNTKQKIEKQNAILLQKQAEFKELSSALSEIETLIGISAESNTTIQQRVDATKLTSTHMTTLLQLIPSGRPIFYNGTTSLYGNRINPITHQKEFHKGIDYRAKTGTPIYATADGVVEWAGYHKKSGYGNLVIIRHAYGFKSYYGHMQRVKVQFGDFVKKGDIIGLSGNTGMSSGPHLHYELKFLYRDVNPIYFTLWSIDNFQDIFQKISLVPWNRLFEVTKDIVIKNPTHTIPLSYEAYKEQQKKK
ncbi:Cell wall endopeptidase, family M23/M37 [hydrothermal vent metagenome]|uniref:Cell wall endopeptidase, family M23/M37 n=1 Tax=hydrothermal vent metagenome TaxID=652676 RepID=A0A1W1D2C0_9ZZZZ